jgi:hypothetical protein
MHNEVSATIKAAINKAQNHFLNKACIIPIEGIQKRYNGGYGVKTFSTPHWMTTCCHYNQREMESVTPHQSFSRHFMEE